MPDQRLLFVSVPLVASSGTYDKCRCAVHRRNVNTALAEKEATTMATKTILMHNDNPAMEIAIPADDDEPTRPPMDYAKAVGSIDYDRRQTVHRIADLVYAEMQHNNDPRLKMTYTQLIAAADAMYAASKGLRELAAAHDQTIT